MISSMFFQHKHLGFIEISLGDFAATLDTPGLFRALWLGGRLGRRSDDAEAGDHVKHLGVS